MAYASLSDIDSRARQEAYLLVAESEAAPGELDAAAITQAFDDATGEMDTYIGKRYPLPLVFSPAILTRLCLDIALYQLGLDAHGNTEEKRQRYEDAIRLLVRISKGEVELDLSSSAAPDTDEDGNPLEVVETVRMPDAEITYEDRRFCRSSMQGLL